MARGPKKHLKRLNAPKTWSLSKLGGIWAPRPSTGPHKLRESLPLTIAIRNRLKYALTRREVLMIVMRRQVEVDGKVRTDINYPAGFMDVVSIPKTKEQFRVMYDVKGRYVLHAIDAAESGYKLCRVTNVSRGNKTSIGRNPFMTAQAGTIPYLTTHDGRTIRYPDPLIKKNDVIRFDLKTGRITGRIKFEVGNLAMVTKGANIGRVGVITARERHPGSFEIVHLTDRKNNQFATRLSNVFVIGEGQKAWVTLPKAKGVKLSILEERSEKQQAKKTEKKKARAGRARAAAE
jgi:small subunit ribosomal protein S4e